MQGRKLQRQSRIDRIFWGEFFSDIYYLKPGPWS